MSLLLWVMGYQFCVLFLELFLSYYWIWRGACVEITNLKFIILKVSNVRMSIYLSSPKFSKAYNFISLGKGSLKKKWEFSHSEQGPPLQKVGKSTFFYLICRFQKVFLCEESFFGKFSHPAYEYFLSPYLVGSWIEVGVTRQKKKFFPFLHDSCIDINFWKWEKM